MNIDDFLLDIYNQLQFNNMLFSHAYTFHCSINHHIEDIMSSYEDITNQIGSYLYEKNTINS